MRILTLLGLLAIGPAVLLSQNFSFIPGTIKVIGNPGDELIVSGTLQNLTSSTIEIKLIREKNVMIDAPGWTTFYTTNIFYVPTIDSVHENLYPNSTVDFYVHIFTDSFPDSATVRFRFENVNNSSNQFTQTYTGITMQGASTGNLMADRATIQIQPQPVSRNTPFMIQIAGSGLSGKLTLYIYDLLGNCVSQIGGLTHGNNPVEVNLAPGVYSYLLSDHQQPAGFGKLLVID